MNCLSEARRPPGLRYLSSLNRRKILSENMFAFLFALLTALSFYNLSSVMDGYLAEGRYEISDGTEYRILYAGMERCARIVLLIVFLVLVPVFNTDKAHGAE